MLSFLFCLLLASVGHVSLASKCVSLAECQIQKEKCCGDIPDCPRECYREHAKCNNDCSVKCAGCGWAYQTCNDNCAMNSESCAKSCDDEQAQCQALFCTGETYGVHGYLWYGIIALFTALLIVNRTCYKLC
eukprot:UN09931